MNNLTEIKAFLPISNYIGTAGQPTESQLLAILVSGYETVINLALPQSPGAIPNESQLIQDLGLQYIHIPVEWEAPTIQDALRFFEVMNQHLNEKIFIHCAANKRVSVFIFLYRTLCLGVDASIAQENLHQIWQPNSTWAAFIQKMTTEFQPRTAPSISPRKMKINQN